MAPQGSKVKNIQDYEYVIISEDGGSKSKDLNIKDYINIIRRRKWLIIFPLFLIMPVVLASIIEQRPLYRATTRLLIEDSSPTKSVLIQDNSNTEPSQNFYNTQYELIKSRAIMEEVAQTIPFDERGPVESSRLVQVINTIMDFPAKAINKITNTVSEVLSGAGDTTKDRNLPLIKTPKSTNPRLDSAIARLQSGLQVEPVKETKLVDISLQGSDPVEVTQQVDMIAEVYVRRNLSNKLDITKKGINWLKREVDAVREKMKASQSSLQEFNENKNLIFNENSEKGNVNQQQLDALNSSYVEIHTSRIKIQATLDDIDSLSKRGLETIIEYPMFLENTIIRLLRTKYMDLKTQYDSLSNIYQGQHFKMIQLKSEIDSIKSNINEEIKKIKNSLQNEYKSLLTKEENIKKNLRDQQKEVLNINKYLSKYNETKRDIDIEKEFYITISKKLAEVALNEVMGDNNIKVIQRALMPNNPVSIRNSKKILFGMVLGIGFGGCLAFIAEHFDRRFKTVGEAERELEIPFLGFIPHFKTGRKKNKLISLQSPHSLASEAYRNLRTWVQVPNKNLGSTLLLTSATPREGKSTTAANLAISFAQLGLEVLLVEADLRRPTLDRIFNFEGHIGLADILTRGIDWREAVQHIGIYNMEVLLAGTPLYNPTEILSTLRMKELIQTWRESFDIIIFDSPITLSISDVAVLAPEMDRTLLIHCPSKTGKEEVVEATRRLRSINTNIHGIVFNNVRSKELKNYYSQVQSYNKYYSSRRAEVTTPPSRHVGSTWRKLRQSVKEDRTLSREINIDSSKS